MESEKDDEVVIHEVKEMVPYFNNNISAFKSTVHKLERHYKNNRICIHELQDKIKELNNDIDNLKKEIESKKDNLIETMNNYYREYNFDIVKTNNKIDNYISNNDYKYLFFTLLNISISAFVYFFK